MEVLLNRNTTKQVCCNCQSLLIVDKAKDIQVMEKQTENGLKLEFYYVCPCCGKTNIIDLKDGVVDADK